MSREAYEQALDQLAVDFLAWTRANPDRAARFRLPPAGVMVVAPLDAVARICGNADASACVEDLVACSRARFGPGKGPTVFMLGLVLEHFGVEIERVGLSELGLRIGAS